MNGNLIREVNKTLVLKFYFQYNELYYKSNLFELENLIKMVKLNFFFLILVNEIHATEYEN